MISEKEIIPCEFKVQTLFLSHGIITANTIFFSVSKISFINQMTLLILIMIEIQCVELFKATFTH